MQDRASFRDYAVVACETVNLELNYMSNNGFLDARNDKHAEEYSAMLS